MDIDLVVAVCMFTILLYPYPRLMYLPILSAIAFPADPQGASFVAFVCVMCMGSVMFLIDAGIAERGK